MRNTVQALALLLVGAVVVGALWIREIRTAEFRRSQDFVLREPFQVTNGRAIGRAEAVAACADSWEGDLPDRPAPVGDPQRLRSLLPVGQTRQVVVKGGLVARLQDRDYGIDRRRHVAYAFEVCYRGTIESNDGNRVVERRWFRRVRMAKILSAAEDMSVDLGPPDQSLLDRLDPLAPTIGMAVAPVGQVADAILATGTESVLKLGTSHAFLEEDPLSGKTVRLTYVDGVGIESLEPLGCSLGADETYILLREPYLMDCLGPQPATGDRNAQHPISASRLAAFVDPTVVIFNNSYDLRLQPAEPCDRHPHRYTILRRWIGMVDKPDGADASLAPYVPMGTFDVDASGRLVRSATVRWPMWALVQSRNRLLYEAGFQGSAVLNVSYCCEVL